MSATAQTAGTSIRAPDELRSRYDAVIVGGGIYGIMAALEGAARGRSVLLVERDDFGSHTTGNWLRTIHGGLRYLQTMDLGRAVGSSRERAWWFRHFPDLVRPIKCLMPLYGGIRSPAIFHGVFPAARLLRITQVPGVPAPTSVVSADEVEHLFPLVRREHLKGGAIWHDGFMPTASRVVMEAVRWAAASGAHVRNGHELLAGAREQGLWRITLRNTRSGSETSVLCEHVINCAGPQVDDVARRLTGADTGAFVPTLAWNLLVNRPAPSSCSIAVSPPRSNAATYFVHRFGDKTLLGTGHSPGAERRPSPDQIGQMVTDLAEAIPQWGIGPGDVEHVLAGTLPGAERSPGALLKSPRIIFDANVIHVIGVKFTEAVRVARHVWRRLGAATRPLPPRPARNDVPGARSLAALDAGQWRTLVCELQREEQARGVEDVVWRRSEGWTEPELRKRCE